MPIRSRRIPTQAEREDPGARTTTTMTATKKYTIYPPCRVGIDPPNAVCGVQILNFRSLILIGVRGGLIVTGSCSISNSPRKELKPTIGSASISCLACIPGSGGIETIFSVHMLPNISGEIPDDLSIREFESAFLSFPTSFIWSAGITVCVIRVSVSSGTVLGHVVPIGVIRARRKRIAVGPSSVIIVSGIEESGTGYPCTPVVSLLFDISGNRHPFVVCDKMVPSAHRLAGSNGSGLCKICDRIIACFRYYSTLSPGSGGNESVISLPSPPSFC